jgi:predicted nucleic-acid-binding protein
VREPAKKLPDSNTILRYLLGEDPDLYEKAVELFEKVRTGEEKAVILESVLVECVYVLTKFYKVPEKEAAAKLQALFRYRGIMNEDRDDLIEALKIFAMIPSLAIVDCILCVKAAGSNMSLFTFGKALGKYSKCL